MKLEYLIEWPESLKRVDGYMQDGRLEVGKWLHHGALMTFAFPWAAWFNSV